MLLYLPHQLYRTIFHRFRSMDPYSATDKLPAYMKDPVKGRSTAVTCAPFHDARDTSLPYWEWLEQPVTLPDGTKGVRPQLPIFGKAMMGGGRVFSPPHVHGRVTFLLAVP